MLLGAGKPRPAEGPDLRQVTEYTVKAGETLAGIARRVEVPRVLIIEANGLKPPHHVRAGQVLVIPRRRSHIVVAGETGFSIAYTYGVPWPLIATANGLERNAKVRAGQELVIPTPSKPGVAEAAAEAAQAELATAKPAARTGGRDQDTPAKLGAPVDFAWPATGPVRRGFTPRGRRGSHDGIDIAGPEGASVRAAAPGTVVFAGDGAKAFGNLVIVDHGKGWFSAYAKLQKVTVKKGRKVRAGERVGLLGHTGTTSQTELHFEIRHKTVPQNPLGLLPERTDRDSTQRSAQKTVPIAR